MTRIAHKMDELATAKPLLDAIAATPEVRRTARELQAVARGDVVEAAEAVKR